MKPNPAERTRSLSLPRMRTRRAAIKGEAVLGSGEWAFFVFALLAAIFVVAIAFEARLIVRQIDALRNANTDNVPWNLSQVEVEMLRFNEALHEGLVAHGAAVESDDPEAQVALDNVRLWFDIMYSRMVTLRDSGLYVDAQGDREFVGAAENIWDFLEASVPLIDGPDDMLVENLPALEDAVEERREDFRLIGVRGITQFSSHSEQERRSVMQSLLILGITTLVAVLLLLVLTANLWNLGRNLTLSHQKREASRARMAAMIATSPMAILVVDPEMKVIDANDAAVGIFGFDRDEMLGEQIVHRFIPPEAQLEIMQVLKDWVSGQSAGGETGRTEVTLCRKSGETFPAELAYSAQRDAAGDIFIAFIRDMSRQVADEAALKQARDRALDGQRAREQLLATMSHEMRTPLHGMQSSMEVLEETPLDDMQHRHLGIMKNAARLLLRLIDDVLDIASGEKLSIEPRPERVSLRAIIEQVVAEFAELARKNGNLLTIDAFPDDVDMVICDQMRLRQVLFNILGNAMKFTEGGRVGISVLHGDGPDELVFRVSDTGIGIAEKDRAHIFEDFFIVDGSYSRRHSGTGLGLGIAQRLIDAMGGAIGVESEIGQGSTFWFRLRIPSADVAGAAAGAKDRDSHIPAEPGFVALRHPCDVLLVEDNPVNRSIARAALEKHGCTVTEAGDGLEAVQLSLEHDFSAVLMDISMPRMDGLEATRRIRSQSGGTAKAPIIALTAHAFPEDRKRILMAGCNRVLVKPFPLKTLIEELDLALADWNRGALQVHDGLVDPDFIKEVASTLGPERAHALVEDFARDTRRALEELLGDSGAQRVSRDISDAAHRLRGSAHLVGASLLADLLAEIERRSNADEALSAQVFVDLSEAVEITIAALRGIAEGLVTEPTV